MLLSSKGALQTRVVGPYRRDMITCRRLPGPSPILTARLSSPKSLSNQGSSSEDQQQQHSGAEASRVFTSKTSSAGNSSHAAANSPARRPEIHGSYFRASEGQLDQTKQQVMGVQQQMLSVGESATAALVPVTLPVTTPVPLCSSKEVLRLLTAVEAPEYCIRVFRDNSITGADLMSLTAQDLQDPRFKLPDMVIRKILRIPAAWQLMCEITGSVSCTAIRLPDFRLFLQSKGISSPADFTRLLQVFGQIDSDSDGTLSLEDFQRGAVFILHALHSIEVEGYPALHSPKFPGSTLCCGGGSAASNSLQAAEAAAAGEGGHSTAASPGDAAAKSKSLGLTDGSSSS